MWNFCPSGGMCFGYVMTLNESGVDAERIAGRSMNGLSDGAAIARADVVVIARRPGVGQVVVGAYLDAHVFQRKYRKRKNPRKEGKFRKLPYVCEAPAASSYLIPKSDRDFKVPYAPVDGPGFPGHSNVNYADKVTPKSARFLKDLKEYLRKLPDTFPSMAAGEEVRNLTADDQEREELEKISTDRTIKRTTRVQLVRARIGQGLFRNRVERIEKGCRVIKATEPHLLRASHIKPWAKSSNQEKLDGENGLLLTPRIDHLFDQGYISFMDDGSLLLSERLPKRIVSEWRLPKRCHGAPFTPGQAKYLRYHRR